MDDKHTEYSLREGSPIISVMKKCSWKQFITIRKKWIGVDKSTKWIIAYQLYPQFLIKEGGASKRFT